MKILIANPFGIGDVLFTTPVIANLKGQIPRVEIAYLCNKRVAPLLKEDPRIYKIFVYEKDELKGLWSQSKCSCIKEVHHLLTEIKKQNFDHVLDFSLAGEFGFFFWLAGIKSRIGFNYKKRSKFLNKKVTLDGFDDKHVIEYYLELLRFFNIEPVEKHINVFVSKKEEEKAASLLKSHDISENDRIVAVAPGGGASWGKDSHRKRYSPDKFGNVCDKLIKESNVKVVVLGSNKEKTITSKLLGNMKSKPSFATNNLSIREFVAVLSKCKLLLCNDGGPLHIGVGLGIPTVSIFGPVSEKVYGPYPKGDKHIVAKANLNCRPCYRNFKVPKCVYNTKLCFEELDSDEIFNLCKKMLELQ